MDPAAKELNPVPTDNHPDIERARDVQHATTLQHGNIALAHSLAMQAKEHAFRAQDAVSRAWSEGTPGPQRRTLLRKVEKRLARVRAELEQLDNHVLGAMRAGLMSPGKEGAK